MVSRKKHTAAAAAPLWALPTLTEPESSIFSLFLACFCSVTIRFCCYKVYVCTVYEIIPKKKKFLSFLLVVRPSSRYVMRLLPGLRGTLLRYDFQDLVPPPPASLRNFAVIKVKRNRVWFFWNSRENSGEHCFLWQRRTHGISPVVQIFHHQLSLTYTYILLFFCLGILLRTYKANSTHVKEQLVVTQAGDPRKIIPFMPGFRRGHWYFLIHYDVFCLRFQNFHEFISYLGSLSINFKSC